MKRKGFIALIAILLLAGASYALGWSTLFTVSSVEVKGTNQYLPQVIKIGEKLARVEPREVASAYKKINFIRDAKVSRNWFTGKVSISVVMRTPIAIYNNLAIDSSGKSFEVKDQRIGNLPTIQAPTAPSAVAAVDFFTALPSDIKTHMVVLKVQGFGTYVLEVKVGNRIVKVVWGTATQNQLKAKVYKALLAQSENSKIVAMDLSAPHAPIVS